MGFEWVRRNRLHCIKGQLFLGRIGADCVRDVAKTMVLEKCEVKLWLLTQKINVVSRKSTRLISGTTTAR